MIELPVDLQITRGLAKSKEDLKGLRRSLNLYPKEDKLVSAKALSTLWANVTVWPWPQLFRLEHDLFVCDYDSISVVRDEGLQLLLDSIDTRGYPWSAAIVGNFPVFTNNRVVVHPNVMAPLPARAADMEFDELVVQQGAFPVGRDICQYNGQFVVAAPWMYGVWHMNHVAWARPGTLDFEIGTRTSAGYSFIQYCGQILRVVSTSAGFIAYGTTGVAKFTATDHPSDYNHDQISRVGLYSQLAVVNCQGFHAYVGTDRRLYKVTDKVEELGYDYIFKEATGEISLHWDEEEKLVYASL